MIKNIAIKDKKGLLLLKIICRKNGIYDMTKLESLKDIYVEIKNEKNYKICFGEGK